MYLPKLTVFAISFGFFQTEATYLRVAPREIDEAGN